MSIVLITGSSGLVGSESVNFFCEKGFDVIGIDNNLRKFFFGSEGLKYTRAAYIEREVAHHIPSF